VAAAERIAAAQAADARAAAWALEWSAWYGEYAARAAEQSERTLALYRRVADAIARGELPSTALNDMLAPFYGARGKAYADRLAELTGRFFSRLVETAALYSREMAQSVMPGVPAPPPLPALDPADPNRWFRQLTEYGGSLSAHIAASYKAFLDRVAAGQVDTDGLQNAASAYLERRFPDYLRQLGRIYFDLLTDLNGLRAEGERDFLEGVLAAARPEGPAPPLRVDLMGPAAERVSARLSIANSRGAPARIVASVGDIRRADGIGPAFAPDLSITPGALELGPAEEGSITLALALDPAAYAPGALYLGALSVAGAGELPLEIPLRVMVTAEPPPAPGGPQSP
jgi:hypothetical protein